MKNKKAKKSEKSRKEKVVCLISGGIDSPVATALAAKHYEIVPVHFSLYPFYCKGSFETMIAVLKYLKKKTKFREFIIFPHAEILSAVLKSENRLARDYMCVMCRKAMFKAAEKICESEGAAGIVTGESLAQKASQTLQNLAATSSGIKYPMIRPLLGMDKTEIIKLSKGLEMPEKHVGCCTATPEWPVTKADAITAENLFAELGLQKIIDDNFRKIVRIRKFEKTGYEILQKVLGE
ncbi:MAG: hypothetical protein WA139_05405 [Candidatus Aenigmatarchaeota archaeon]